MNNESREWVALVPMRHHSERVPGKNHRPLAGRPLYQHILNSLHEVQEFDGIVVDTDSPVIVEGVAEHYPDVVVLDRPAELREGEIPMNWVLEHDVTQVEARYYLQTHSTNPFLSAATISRAVQAFLDAFPGKDSLFSVNRLQTRLWDAQSRPVNHDPSILLRTQDLPPVFEENSCIYIFERQTFLERRNRIGERPLLFETPPDESLDIDDETDFALAELMLRARSE